jgi:hypothetical protein
MAGIGEQEISDQSVFGERRARDGTLDRVIVPGIVLAYLNAARDRSESLDSRAGPCSGWHMATTTPRPAEETDFATSLEWWFKYHGVPQFSNRYSVTDRLGLLLFLMLAVVAFELGAAPYLEPSAPELLLALVVLMCLTLCVKPALRAILEPDCPKAPRGRSRCGS